MAPFPENPKKILIRSTNWIGDAVMTTPAVRSIRAHFPESELVLLAHPWVADVFRASPRIDRIIGYEKKTRHKGIGGMVRLASQLRQERFDAAILLQNAFEAALLARAAGIPARGGYNTDGRGVLLTHAVRRDPTIKTRHQVHYYQEMVAGLGVQVGPDELELFLPQDVQQQVQHHLAALGTTGQGRSLIGLNPGAAYGPAKQWPAEHFAALAARLCQDHGAVVAIFGTEADRQTAQTIAAQVGQACQVIDLTGKTSLMEAMAYIGACDAFVTNDSGLMHVAAALAVPLVAIFGSTNPVTTGPFSPKALLVREVLDCSPCLKTHCPKQHFNCMRSLTPDRVYDAVAQLLTPHP